MDRTEELLMLAGSYERAESEDMEEYFENEE
jgi:stalled ribosome alternative rescue factor ArfA